MNMSIFRPIFVAYAAENLEQGNGTLQVWPHELFPTMDGDITPATLVLNTRGVDHLNRPYNDKVRVGATITAQWLPQGRSLKPPDIRRGERLEIYQSGDSPIYYWRPMGLDQNLRRLETVILAVSANPSNEDQERPDASNSYFLEVSTHQKLVTFSTSMINKEASRFFGQFDTGKGTFTLEDEKENTWFFDSVNTLFRFINADKTMIEMDRTHINAYAKDTINILTDYFNLEALSEINFKTKKWFANAKESITFKTKKWLATATDSIGFNTNEYKLEATSSIDMNTKVYSMTAGQKATVKAPDILLDGNVMVTGTTSGLMPALFPAFSIGVPGGAPTASMSSSGTLETPQAIIPVVTFQQITTGSIVAGSASHPPV